MFSNLGVGTLAELVALGQQQRALLSGKDKMPRLSTDKGVLSTEIPDTLQFLTSLAGERTSTYSKQLHQSPKSELSATGVSTNAAGHRQLLQ